MLNLMFTCSGRKESRSRDYHGHMVSMHILNENEPSYALKNLATKWGRYFGFEDKSATYEELFSTGGFQDTPLDIGTIYACRTLLVVQMYQWILGHLKNNKADEHPQIRN